MSGAHGGDATTRALAHFVAELRFEELPAEVVAHARECLLDTLGCGLFGSTLPWSALLERTLGKLDHERASLCWGSGARLSAPDAALVNGAAVHSFELDDLHKVSILHPGSVVLPALLAAADCRDERPPLDGRGLVKALVAGYEVGARVGAALGTAHLLAGWHPTGTHGTIAAAAAAASVLGLDPGRAQHALGIAGSQSSGLMASQYSSMVKRFHAGRAAQSGLYGALLAREGYTGITNLLESEYGGYAATFSPTHDLSGVAEGLGSRWEVLRVGFKPYATNGSCHPAIDLLRELRATHALRPDDVAQLRLFVSSATYAHVGWPYHPDSVTTAQMNLSYIAAVVLSDGEAFVDQFAESRLADPVLLSLARRVTVVADPTIDARGPSHRHATRVELETTDGRLLTGERASARGSDAHPLSTAEVHEKFRLLGEKALAPSKVAHLEALVARVEELEHLAELEVALTP